MVRGTLSSSATHSWFGSSQRPRHVNSTDPLINHALRVANEPTGHLGKNLAVTEHGHSVGPDALEHEGRENSVEVGEHQHIVYEPEKADEVVVSRTPSLSNSIGGNGVAALTNPNLDPLDTKLDGRKRDEHQPSAKSSCSRGLDEGNEFVGAEDGFESSATVLGYGSPCSLFRAFHTDHIRAMLAEIQTAFPGFGLGFAAHRVWIDCRLQQQ